MTDPLESVTLPQVKLIRMLPPAVALMVVGTWLGPQRRSMATLEQDCALLRHRLAATTGADPSPAKAPAPNKSAKAGTPVNWKTLADPAMQKEMGRRMTEFRERMMSMAPAQMRAIIAEIRASRDLTDETRRRLVAVSVLALANNHPQAVLALFTGSDIAKDDRNGGYVISSSLARYEPVTAAQWALTLPDDTARVATLKRIYQEWPKGDPAAAEAAAAFAQQHGIQ